MRRKIFVLVIVKILVFTSFYSFTTEGLKINNNLIENYFINHSKKDSLKDLNPRWVRTWGGNKVESEVTGIAIDKENGYIYLAGETQSYQTHSNYFESMFLLKFDVKNGDLIWCKMWNASIYYDAPANSRAFSITYYKNHIYVVGSCNIEDSNQIYFDDAFLFKYDFNGNLINYNIFDSSSRAFDVIVYNDYVYVTGDTWKNGISSNVSLWIFNLDCEKLSAKNWDGIINGDDYGTTLVENNGYLYISGTTHVLGTHGRKTHDVLLLKFDTKNPNSELIFIDSWGGNDWDEAKRIIAYDDYLYITGFTESFNNDADVFLLKYDTNNESLEYNRIWGVVEKNIGYGITINDEYIFIAGHSYMTFSYQDNFAFILKYDLYGNLVWDKKWNYKNDILPFASADSITSYNGFLYVGGHTQTQNNDIDTFLFKCDLGGGKAKDIINPEEKFLKKLKICITINHSIYSLFQKLLQKYSLHSLN